MQREVRSRRSHLEQNIRHKFRRKLNNKNEFERLQNTTTIISSHRLSSVQNLNEIIILKEGKIIQKGNHEKLINQKGYYKELYYKQLTKKDD